MANLWLLDKTHLFLSTVLRIGVSYELGRAPASASLNSAIKAIQFDVITIAIVESTRLYWNIG